VMFDGRETIVPLNNPSTFSANLITDLTHQAMDATNGHAQASPPLTISDPRLPPIVNLELGFFTTQTTDQSAGQLNVLGANGGPQYLAGQPYYPGVNDSLTPSVFNPMAFTIYSAWQNFPGSSTDPTVAARQAVAAGELLFDTFPLTITAVRGLNDNPALGSPALIMGTCTTCHDRRSLASFAARYRHKPLRQTGNERANRWRPLSVERCQSACVRTQRLSRSAESWRRFAPVLHVRSG